MMEIDFRFREIQIVFTVSMIEFGFVMKYLINSSSLRNVSPIPQSRTGIHIQKAKVERQQRMGVEMIEMKYFEIHVIVELHTNHKEVRTEETVG